MRTVLCALVLALLPLQAFAWGTKGHTIINRLAAQSLPASLPAFVRTAAASNEIAYLGPEEDRIKGAGRSWDDDNDPGHYVDLQDNGTIDNVVRLTSLPVGLKAYARALARAHADPYREGYLPYSIVDGWERVRKDFAIWRVDDYLAQHAKSAQARAQFAVARALRQVLTLRDIGDWGHFVADGSQPLHVTIHYNEGGAHARFESTFVDAHVSIGDVRRRLAPHVSMRPATLVSQARIDAIVGRYLAGTARAVPQLYAIDRAGGFVHATPQSIGFAAAQLARGASMLRDLTALAWQDSLNESVGYPAIHVRDVLAGRVLPTQPI